MCLRNAITMGLPVLVLMHASLAHAAPDQTKDIVALEAKLDQLTTTVGQLQHLEDVNAIQNIIGKMAYLYEAGMYEQRLQFIATKTPGVTVEIGARGVFKGLDGARREMVEVERETEQSSLLGMKKAFPNVNFPTAHTGMYESELVGTPVIEVGGDGKTARGQWTSLMISGKSHANDPSPEARWIWWKTSVDFVKEDGRWKIWHYLKNPIFSTPYDTDWVKNSLTLPPLAALGKGLPATHGGNPDCPPEHYDSYRITRQPRLAPNPPEPYQTFDQTQSYAACQHQTP